MGSAASLSNSRWPACRQGLRRGGVGDFEEAVEVGAGEEAGRLAAADDEQRQAGFGGDAVEGGVEVGQHLTRNHVVRLAGHVDLEEGAAVGVLLDGDGFGLEEHESIPRTRRSPVSDASQKRFRLYTLLRSVANRMPWFIRSLESSRSSAAALRSMGVSCSGSSRRRVAATHAPLKAALEPRWPHPLAKAIVICPCQTVCQIRLEPGRKYRRRGATNCMNKAIPPGAGNCSPPTATTGRKRRPSCSDSDRYTWSNGPR